MQTYNKSKQRVVLSGINLFEGGPLSVYYDCLDAIVNTNIWKKYNVIAFVHKKNLFEKYKTKIKIIELPKSRKNYFNRLYYEYFYFYRFSCKHSVCVWISLHDITPRVKAKRQYTYCHNATPFLQKDWSMARYGWKEFIFSFFYKYVYRINISSATALIVQQDWMRKEFRKMYHVNNIIVSRPIDCGGEKYRCEVLKSKKPSFVFAAYPRLFKNHEVILKACEKLEKDLVTNFEVWLTIDGTENEYSSMLVNRYKHLESIKWLGILSREEMFKKYYESWYMIFPSLLETWGLPISEYKQTNNPVILADLPYAHETIGSYDNVIFFAPNDYIELSRIMKNCIENNIEFSKEVEVRVGEPCFDDWNQLVNAII